MPHGPLPELYRVRSLEEALHLYARDFINGLPAPSFSVDPARFEQFEAYARKSYTIHATRADGSTVVLRGVMLNFVPEEPEPPEGCIGALC